MGFVQQCLSSAVSHSPVVVDVGANRGQFASLVLSLDSSAKVLSYEANPKAVKIYEKNLKEDLHRKKRVTIVPKAISDKQGSITLYDYSTESASEHASVNKEIFDGIHNSSQIAAFPVEAATLDDELAVYPHISKICLFKFDIEGHELEAIEGSMKALANAGFPPVLIEFNTMNAVMGSSFYKIRKMLGPMYKPYRLLPKGSLLPLEGSPAYDTEIYAYQNIAFIRDKA